MDYVSTRNAGLRVSAAKAIATGIAPDGGLFCPTEIPSLTKADLDALLGMDYKARAAFILGKYLTDFTAEELQDFTQKAYADEKFGGPNTAPVVDLKDGKHILELWHGPTCAFKDMALQMLPHLLTASLKKTGETRTACILVATSGDTGKAALEGFADVPGTKIMVYYPVDGVSPMQKLQMTTQKGDNVEVVAIHGNFDDAQSAVKRIFTDKATAEKMDAQGLMFSSANSINWGRLAPQIVYYFYAYFRLAEQGAVAWGSPVDFCVPTGNFGDILAGYYAKRMGLPVGKLVCASNQNNVLSDFIRTGTYDRRREFYKTTSPSMDILISSNLERLLYHLCGDDTKVAGWMRELALTGCYTVDAETLAKLQENFGCGWASDAQAAEELCARYETDRYLCDPHTAVAFRVAAQARGEAPMVVLSTASPFKFPRDVLAALKAVVPQGDFAAMAALTAETGCAAPESLRCLESLPVRFTEVIAPAQIRDVALR